MIKQSIIQLNAQIYLKKMEEKLTQDQNKISQLKKTINDAAYKIQRCFRSYLFYKQTKAARKIQKWWKKVLKRMGQRKQKLAKFKQWFNTYKIFYFLKSIKTKLTKAKTKNTPKYFSKNLPLVILKHIKSTCSKFIILLSSLQAQHSYLKKYTAYDRKSFTQQWQSHQKRQREWIWSQIKKKWVKKDGTIWINESQKQINAQKYVNNLIEQTYLKQYQRFQHSQARLKQNYQQIQNKIMGLKHAYYLSLLK